MYAFLGIADITRGHQTPRSEKDLNLDRFAQVIDGNRAWAKGVKVITRAVRDVSWAPARTL